MRNPFAKPHTPGQWLPGSVCWTVACVGGWLLLGKWALDVPYKQKTPDEPLLFVGFFVAYGLLWWKGVAGLRINPSNSDWSQIAAYCWLCILTLFQLLWLGIVLLMLTAPYFYNPDNLSN